MNALILAIGLSIAVTGPGVVLVDEGQPRAAIVVADDASPTVQFAAGQLADYLRRMSTAEVPIVAERRFQGDSLKRIDVGPTRQARRLLPEGLLGQEERVFIHSGDGGVVITGGGDRGTLFGVYRFLELLGCRWLAPGTENEVVPQRSTVSLPAVTIDTAPAFECRLFQGSRSEEATDWGLKMGMNGLYTAESAAANGGSLYWPDAVPGVHAYNQIIPNDPYFKEHPEWFPLRSGRRTPGDIHGSQLCVTADGLADQFAANVNAIFDADPACRLLSISPNDGRGWCECPRCAELDQKLCGGRTTQQGLGGERPFRGDRVFWFANEVARRVAEKHPDKKLLVLAYINYAEPPDTIRPLPNVVPLLCHYAPADYSRPIADPESEPNRLFNDLLCRWVKITPDILIYSYVSKSMWWRLPRPVVRTFSADIQHYHELGVHRYYCQSKLSDWPLGGPLYYVIARLLWDPAADPQAIADEWIGEMFGPAGDAMRQFYAAVDASVRKTGRPYSDNPPRDVPGLYDRPSLEEALAALERAEKAAVDAPWRDRVAEVARTFRYGYWMIESLCRHRCFEDTADPEALKAAVTARKKAFSFQKNADAARKTDGWQLFSQLGVLAEGFGKAETKGGRRCWNSDESGVGDGAKGWATFVVAPPDVTKPVTVEVDVWGESSFSSLVINTEPGVWNRLAPDTKLSHKPQWDTLVFHIPPKLMNQSRKGQKIGFGGGDSQVWIAQIRVEQP